MDMENSMRNYDEISLYQIPIEQLNLTVKTLNICLRQGVTTIRDAIDAVEMLPDGVGTSTSLVFQETMLEKVLPELIKHGYLEEEKFKLNSSNFAQEIITEIKEKLVETGYWKEK